jgi:hypothetical protein
MNEVMTTTETIGTERIDQELFGENISKTSILTYTGRFIDPCDPDPNSINIVDIAHALGNSCRYGGHCPRFYSVAEHSVFVKNLMVKANKDFMARFAGLMHDAEEAYLMDLPTPIKRNFPSFVEAGVNLRRVIFEKFNIPWELYDEVGDFDKEAYAQERTRLWSKGNWHSYRPQEAKHRFLESFRTFASVLNLPVAA